MAEDKPGLVVTSGVSNETGMGFVSMHWRDETGQLTPGQAREFALGVIEAADAAEHDAAIVRWAADAGMDELARARILAAVRKGRLLPPLVGSGRAQT